MASAGACPLEQPLRQILLQWKRRYSRTVESEFALHAAGDGRDRGEHSTSSATRRTRSPVAEKPRAAVAQPNAYRRLLDRLSPAQRRGDRHRRRAPPTRWTSTSAVVAQVQGSTRYTEDASACLRAVQNEIRAAFHALRLVFSPAWSGYPGDGSRCAIDTLMSLNPAA